MCFQGAFLHTLVAKAGGESLQQQLSKSQLH